MNEILLIEKYREKAPKKENAVGCGVLKNRRRMMITSQYQPLSPPPTTKFQP